MNYETHDRESSTEAKDVAIQRLLDPKGPKAVILRKQGTVATADFDTASALNHEGWAQHPDSPRTIDVARIYFLHSPPDWEHHDIMQFLEAVPPVLPPLPRRPVSHNLLNAIQH